jgi:hypothetical protein
VPEEALKKYHPKRDPEAARLKLKGYWQDAMKRGGAVESPPEGFAEPESRYKAREKVAAA